MNFLFFSFCITILSVCCSYLFFDRRQDWLDEQINIVKFDQPLQEYYKLPNYKTMLFKFWVWNIENFKDTKNII